MTNMLARQQDLQICCHATLWSGSGDIFSKRLWKKYKSKNERDYVFGLGKLKNLAKFLKKKKSVRGVK
jgi:hypothetical protein